MQLAWFARSGRKIANTNSKSTFLKTRLRHIHNARGCWGGGLATRKSRRLEKHGACRVSRSRLLCTAAFRTATRAQRARLGSLSAAAAAGVAGAIRLQGLAAAARQLWVARLCCEALRMRARHRRRAGVSAAATGTPQCTSRARKRRGACRASRMKSQGSRQRPQHHSSAQPVLSIGGNEPKSNLGFRG